MNNLVDKVRKYGWFNVTELRAVILTIIFLTFIVGFNDGSETFELSAWASNFIIWLIIVTISVLVKLAGHKIYGLHIGFRVEYKLWWYGILISLMLSFVSRGKIWLLIPGGIMISVMRFHRIGHFRFGTNMACFSWISLWGPLSLILFATFVKTLQMWFHIFPNPSPFVDKIFIFNLWYAACSLFPIPPLDGSRVLFSSRLMYSWVAGSIIGYAVLASLGIFSYIYALIIGTIVWFSYYWFVEK